MRNGCSLVVWLSVLLSLPARGQTPADEARARAHFQQGEQLSQAGRYVQALEEFAAGYRLSRRPLFLFNMAECARLAGDGERARFYYQRYLAEDPRGKAAAQAEARLKALPGAPPASPAPLAAPPAARRLKLTPPPKMPAPLPAVIAPPASAPTAVIDLTLPRPPERAPFYRRWPFWAGVGAAVVAGTVIAVATTRGGGGACGAGCRELDFRRVP